jgi:transcriptional regulator GlxA family with amidase domain
LAVGQSDHEISAVDWLEGRGIQISLLTPFLRTAREQSGFHTRATRQFYAVQKFIYANMSDTILLTDLARAAKLHPTCFSNQFRDLVGVRLLYYLKQFRMERAQYLLATTVTSVKEVAAQVGYNNATRFTRTFIRSCGYSPTEYRAMHEP